MGHYMKDGRMVFYDLVSRLQDMIDPDDIDVWEGGFACGCGGGLERTREFFNKHGLDFPRFVEELITAGGNCDCAVIMEAYMNIDEFRLIPTL